MTRTDMGESSWGGGGGTEREGGGERERERDIYREQEGRGSERGGREEKVIRKRE